MDDLRGAAKSLGDFRYGVEQAECREDRLAPQAHGSVVVMRTLVAKLVKSFGLLGNATESLDDFRYAGVGDV